LRNSENWWSSPGAAREFGDCASAKPGFCAGWAPASRNWDETVQWMIRRSKGKALLSLIIKLMFAAAVYAIWQERNHRIFRGRSRNVVNVCSDILFWVRTIINPLSGFQPSHSNRWLVGSWGISEDVLRT
jgi:hypothetical protein